MFRVRLENGLYWIDERVTANGLYIAWCECFDTHTNAVAFIKKTVKRDVAII